MVGATQWKVDCSCLPGVARERNFGEWVRMHSEVSENNHGYFIEEERVSSDVTRDDLLAYLERYETVVACNTCKSIKGSNGDGFQEIRT